MIRLRNINTTKFKNNRLFDQDNLDDAMLTMEKYDEIAKCYLLKTCSPSVAHMILRNPELLSYVSESLMFGSCRWNKDRRGTHYGYLMQCVRWAVLRILRDNNIVYEKSLSDNVYNDGSLMLYEIIEDKKHLVSQQHENLRHYLIKIIKKCRLSNRQRLCLTKIYIDGYTVSELSKELGVSNSMIFLHIKDGISKLQK